MFDKYNKAQRAVLETTLRIIIQKELQATSMALIAKESGVSTGNIYHYFKSKEEIVNELYRAIVVFNGDYVVEGMKKGATTREKFNLGWRCVVELSRTYPEGFQFIEQYSFSPYIREDAKQEAYTGGWCGPMNRLYAEAIAQGLFIPLDPKLLVQMHYGSIVYMVKGELNGSYELTEEAVRGALDACWKAACRQDAAED